MIREVSDLLMEFYSCFSRQSSFFWFVITVFGLIVRNDAYGVTSMIRWLSLKPALYLTYLNFFRASSWKLEEIQQRWSRIVQSRGHTGGQAFCYAFNRAITIFITIL